MMVAKESESKACNSPTTDINRRFSSISTSTSLPDLDASLSVPTDLVTEPNFFAFITILPVREARFVNRVCCAGKTTLLKILAGKHMVGGRDVVRVLNCSAFHDTQLVCNGDLAYLGGSWSKNVGSAVSFSFCILFFL